MNKPLRFVFLAGLVAATLCACGASDEDKQKAAEAAAAAEAAKPVPAPTADADVSAWQKYLGWVVTHNMQGVTSSRPFMYFIPAGDAMEVQTARARQQEEVSNAVARGVLPGNMLAFGGPDSKTTADVIVAAFENAQAGSFQKVVVLFVGAEADKDRVKDALAKSGAEFRFVEMK